MCIALSTATAAIAAAVLIRVQCAHIVCITFRACTMRVFNMCTEINYAISIAGTTDVRSVYIWSELHELRSFL